jgi:hypothetical protein
MRNRRSIAPPPLAPVLTADQLRRRIAQLQRCIDALEAFDPQKVQRRYGEPEVMRLEAMIDEALAASFGHGTPGYNRYRDAGKLDHGPHIMRLGPAFGAGRQIDYDAQDAYEARQYLTEGRARAIALLRRQSTRSKTRSPTKSRKERYCSDGAQVRYPPMLHCQNRPLRRLGSRWRKLRRNFLQM